MKKALLTGCTGQDGSYLTEFLLANGYEVHGVKRRSSSLNTDRIDHIYRDVHECSTPFFLHYGDLTDASSLATMLHDVRPDEVYNLGAQSHVKVSFDIPEYTADAVATGALRILEAVRRSGLKCRFYQASSSEMFGSAAPPQRESTPFHPRSPYGCAKLFGHNITVNYRESYGMHASSGILFNHESPRRGFEFVTRKISAGVARILAGKAQELRLGNLDAKRDWGHAREYVEAMWRMLQQPEPNDYVVATGETHSVREFAEMAFGCVGLDYRKYVTIDKELYRPSEVNVLQGDGSRARRILGWQHTIGFAQLVREMVENDCQRLGVAGPD